MHLKSVWQSWRQRLHKWLNEPLLPPPNPPKEPDPFRRTWYDMTFEERFSIIAQRAAGDLANNRPLTAISHYWGFFKYDPSCEAAHENVAAIYESIGNEAMAGRHWFLKADKSACEQQCVEAFRTSLGNDPVQILRKVTNHAGFSFIHLDDATLAILDELYQKVLDAIAVMPRFAQGGYRHACKRKALRNASQAGQTAPDQS